LPPQTTNVTGLFAGIGVLRGPTFVVGRVSAKRHGAIGTNEDTVPGVSAHTRFTAAIPTEPTTRPATNPRTKPSRAIKQPPSSVDRCHPDHIDGSQRALLEWSMGADRLDESAPL
jgi:hypothetical protein